MARRADLIHLLVGEDEATHKRIAEIFAEQAREPRFLAANELAAALPEIDVLVCGWAPRIDWSAATNLRLLHTLGAGVDWLLPAEGLPEDVLIANARGIHAMEMRDHTLAMMLAFERDLPRTFEQQRHRVWRPFTPGTLSGKTLGLLGLGEVGLPIAAACEALGMRVLGIRKNHRPTPHVEQTYSPADLALVLRSSDYVVVTAPLTDETRHWIDEEALAQMNPDAVLIVVSRGGIVDEEALLKRLEAGTLRGAALDVFAEEPLSGERLHWSTKNLLLTPHIAGFMQGYLERGLRLFLTNLGRLEADQALLTPVDRARGY